MTPSEDVASRGRRRAGRDHRRAALADAGRRRHAARGQAPARRRDLLVQPGRPDRRQRPARVPALLHGLPRPARPARRDRARARCRTASTSPSLGAAGGATARLRRTALPGPLHLLPALGRYPLLSRAERAAVARAALAMRFVDPADPAAGHAALRRLARRARAERADPPGAVGPVRRRDAEHRRRRRLAGAGRHGVPDRRCSARPTRPTSAVPALPLGELHGDAGATRCWPSSARQVAPEHQGRRHRAGRPDGGFRIALAQRRPGDRRRGGPGRPARAGRAAVPAGALPEQTGAGWAGLGASPIVNVHVIYDRPVIDLPFAAAVDSPVQWVFDRTAIVRLDRPAAVPGRLAVGRGPVHRHAGRRAARAVPARAGRAVPGRARRRGHRLLRHPRAAGHVPPGARAAARCGRRPRPRWPGLVLAGAWTDTGWPDTMEGAVRSGLAAARRAAPDQCSTTASRQAPRDGGTSVTAVMPEGVAAGPGPGRPRAAKPRSPGSTPDVRAVARLPPRLADADGQPDAQRQRQGAAARAGPAVRPRRRRAARAGRARRGRGRARAQLLPAARRHHGRRHRAPAPADGLDRVRRRRGHPGRRRAARAGPGRAARGRHARGRLGGPLPVRGGAAADRRAGRGPGLRDARRRHAGRVPGRWPATRPARCWPAPAASAPCSPGAPRRRWPWRWPGSARTSAWPSSSSTTCSASGASPEVTGKPVRADLRAAEEVAAGGGRADQRHRRRRPSCAALLASPEPLTEDDLLRAADAGRGGRRPGLGRGRGRRASSPPPTPAWPTLDLRRRRPRRADRARRVHHGREHELDVTPGRPTRAAPRGRRRNAPRDARPASRTCSALQRRRAGGRASSRPTSRWTPRTCCCASSSASAPTSETAAAARWIRVPAARRRHLGQLLRRPGRPVHHGRGVRRAAAGRRRAGRAAHGAAPRRGSASRAASRRTRVFTRIWLALFGLWSWDDLPALPPELIFLPPWFPLNIYDLACWARQTIVPLTIVGALPPGRGRCRSASTSCTPAAAPAPRRRGRRAPAGTGCFERARPGRCTRYERRPVAAGCGEPRCAAAPSGSSPGRRPTARWGGIQPPWVYSLIALHLLGLRARPPGDGARASPGSDGFTVREDAPTARCAGWRPASRRSGTPCLADDRAGRRRRAAPTTRRWSRAADWLLGEEIRVPGRLVGAPAGRWRRAAGRSSSTTTATPTSTTPPRSCSRCAGSPPGPPAVEAAVDRGRALDARDAVRGRRLGRVRRRQHPRRSPTSCRSATSARSSTRRRADVTAHVVEMLAAEGLADEPAVRGAASSGCCGAQEAGRLVVRPLGRQLRLRHRRRRARAGRRRACRRTTPCIRRAVAWLERHQNADGGWGEDLRSYDDPALDRPRARPPRRRPRGRCSRCSPPGERDGRRGRARRRLAGAHPARRRHLGRAPVHRHRLPRRLLHQLPPLPAGLPGQRARPVPATEATHDRRDHPCAPLRIEAGVDPARAADQRRPPPVRAHRACGTARAADRAGDAARRRRSAAGRDAGVGGGLTADARPGRRGGRHRGARRRRTVAARPAPLLAGDAAAGRADASRRAGRHRRPRLVRAAPDGPRWPPTARWRVDMESALAGRARPGDRPVAVVRAVVDTAGRTAAAPGHRCRRAGRRCARCARAAPVLERWAAAAGPRQVLLAGPRSFCAGVERAIDIVERALDRYGAPVYVRRQIVHNAHVVARPRAPRRGVRRGARRGARRARTVVFAAHGVSPGGPRPRRRGARPGRDRRDLPAGRQGAHRGPPLRRATATRSSLIGHADHEEVEGTARRGAGRIRSSCDAEDVGRARRRRRPGPGRLPDADHARRRRGRARSSARCASGSPRSSRPRSDDICYATHQPPGRRCGPSPPTATWCSSSARRTPRTRSGWSRSPQRAGRAGAPGRRRRATSTSAGWPAAPTIGITAGASAPRSLVDELVARSAGLGPVAVAERRAADENVRFTPAQGGELSHGHATAPEPARSAPT